MQKSLDRDELSQILTASLRRTRSLSIGMGILFLLFSYVGYGLYWQGWDPTFSMSPVGEWTWGGFLALVAFFGVISVYRGLKMLNLKQAPIMQTLSEHPDDILWIYPNVITSRATTATAQYSIYVWLRNGRPININVGKDQVPLVMQAILEYAPHALVGYTAENQEAYRQQVATLKKQSLAEN